MWLKKGTSGGGSCEQRNEILRSIKFGKFD